MLAYFTRTRATIAKQCYRTGPKRTQEMEQEGNGAGEEVSIDHLCLGM